MACELPLSHLAPGGVCPVCDEMVKRHRAHPLYESAEDEVVRLTDALATSLDMETRRLVRAKRSDVDQDYLQRLKAALGDSNADSDADEIVAWAAREHETLVAIGAELGSDDLSRASLVREVRSARSAIFEANRAMLAMEQDLAIARAKLEISGEAGLRADLERANARVKTLEVRLGIIRLASEGRNPK